MAQVHKYLYLCELKRSDQQNPKEIANGSFVFIKAWFSPFASNIYFFFFFLPNLKVISNLKTIQYGFAEIRTIKTTNKRPNRWTQSQAYN